MPRVAGHRFNLNRQVLSSRSPRTVFLCDKSTPEILKAIAGNKPFPKREIPIGEVWLTTAKNKKIIFRKRKDSAVNIGFPDHSILQLAVFNRLNSVIDGLSLQDAEDVELGPGRSNVRYLLLRAAYEIEGNIGPQHPIGAMGSASFGLEAGRHKVLAIVHRFTPDVGSADALQNALASLRLPGQIRQLDDLRSGTMLVAEADGSLAVTLKVGLGYDFSFIREIEGLGLSGDIGLKLETGLSTTLGLEISGRYLIALDRESLDERDTQLRLQILRLRKRGWKFGLNLAGHETGVADAIPEKVDDLVKAVFGVHGRQVMEDLKILENWTDPKMDLSEKVAGLANNAVLDLIRSTTGIDPGEEFAKAKSKFLKRLRMWERLSDRVASVIWSLLDKGLSSKKAYTAFHSSLKALAATKPKIREKELKKLLELVDLERLPIGKWLEAAALQGILAQVENAGNLRATASATLAILGAEFIEPFQKFVNKRLRLDKVREVATNTDWARIDDWMKRRLSAFFDRKLEFADISEIKKTINAAIQVSRDIYIQARQAITSRYDISLAYSYQTRSTRHALLDVHFDLDHKATRSLLQEVISEGNYDRLLVKPTVGVHFGRAFLSHEIARRESVEVRLPFYNSSKDSFRKSLARVRVEEDSGRVLFYELKANDKIAVKGRMSSELAVGVSASIPVSKGLRVYSTEGLRWSYEYLAAYRKLRRAEFERQISPFIHQYFHNHFKASGASSFSDWITTLNRAVKSEIQSGDDEFGDTLVSLQVSLPAKVLASWFRQRSNAQLEADTKEMSRSLQRSLKRLISYVYFQDLSRLRQNRAAAAMLVYAAMPPSSEIVLKGQTITLNAANRAGPYWDWRNSEIRQLMAHNILTQRRLAVLLVDARERLLADGQSSEAEFFVEDEMDDFLRESGWKNPNGNLASLIRAEAEIILGASRALHELHEFQKNSNQQPSRALESLAEFGVGVVTTFNTRIQSRYDVAQVLRPLTGMIFLEASRALDPKFRTAQPSALLSLTFLRDERKEYQLEQFLMKKRPAKKDIALEQRLLTTR